MIKRSLCVAGLIGLETLVSGCNFKVGNRTARIGYSKPSYTITEEDPVDVDGKEKQLVLEQIAEQQTRFRTQINDKYDYLKHLKPFEYVVPNNIIRAIEDVTGKGKDESTSSGLYLPAPHSEKQINKFADKLDELEISKEDRESYENIYSLDKIIIYNETIFWMYDLVIKMPNAQFTIPHERMHLEWAKLGHEEQEKMITTFVYITKLRTYAIKTKEGKDDALKDGVPEEEIYRALNRNSVFLSLFNENWHFGEDALKNPNEFFATLAEGHFPKRIENVIARDKPDAYKIFQRMREASQP